jgi:hypothetical protein
MRKALVGIKVLFILALAGCLKDDRYEDQQMGITVTDIPGVAFTQASKSPVVQGITAVPGAATVNGPIITLETSSSASSDVHITLAYDQSLVTAAGLTPVPAGTFNLSTLTPVIAAGKGSVQDLKLTVTNSTALDPSLIYGVGIKITNVDGGYQIAGNGKSVIFAFAIKNRYDGVYLLKGVHNRPTLNYPYEAEMHMITTGPNAVSFYWPEVNSAGHPIGAGPNNSLSWYGEAVSPVVEFNLSNNLVTNVYNVGAGGPPIDIYAGPGSGQGRFVDDATPTNRKMYVYFRYNANDARGFMDTLTYIGPRP